MRRLATHGTLLAAMIISVLSPAAAQERYTLGYGGGT